MSGEVMWAQIKSDQVRSGRIRSDQHSVVRRAYSLQSSKTVIHLSPSAVSLALNLYTLPPPSPSPISRLNLWASGPFLPPVPPLVFSYALMSVICLKSIEVGSAWSFVLEYKRQQVSSSIRQYLDESERGIERKRYK